MVTDNRRIARRRTQRTREGGLRVALGATAAGIAALMARHALVPALIGMAAGLAGAVAASQLVLSFLFEIQPTDPATFALAIGLFAAVIASLVPALRSGRVSPADVLRHEWPNQSSRNSSPSPLPKGRVGYCPRRAHDATQDLRARLWPFVDKRTRCAVACRWTIRAPRAQRLRSVATPSGSSKPPIQGDYSRD